MSRLRITICLLSLAFVLCSCDKATTITKDDTPGETSTPQLSDEESLREFYPIYRAKIVEGDLEYLNALRPEGMVDLVEKLNPMEQSSGGYYTSLDSTMGSDKENFASNPMSDLTISKDSDDPSMFTVEEAFTYEGGATGSTYSTFYKSRDGRWLIDSEQDYERLKKLVSAPRDPHTYWLLIKKIVSFAKEPGEDEESGPTYTLTMRSDGTFDNSGEGAATLEMSHGETSQRGSFMILPRLNEGESHWFELELSGVEPFEDIDFEFMLFKIPPDYNNDGRLDTIAQHGELIYSHDEVQEFVEKKGLFDKMERVIAAPHTQKYVFRKEFR